ncbi:UNVERIFIED_CONTAM: hypothetical protein Slati_3445200 [Sesamum latifolium]|uniref:Uncharacterized protein n=1 Tax=Sesamum latifolium TaxID=2727402 RepID=A0AAW2UHS4_9LAMI
MGETLFNLVYGSEAVIPIEAELETFTIRHYEQESNDNLLQANMDLVKEVRENAHAHIERYKERVVNNYNRRVQRREFQVGDLVLRRASALGLIGKLVPNLEGPYKVTRVIKFGSYKLVYSDGRKLSRPWNVYNLRKFYF